jgi:flagellar biosynthesis chaperone FliJ
MSRRFRLAALERLRAARLDDATRSLASARRSLAAAVGVREGIAAQLVLTVPPPRGTPQDTVLAGARRDALRARLADADRTVADTTQQVEVAVEAWRCARAELRAVRELHGRHDLAVAAAGARRDQLVLDDLAAQAALRRAARGGAR